MQKHSPLVYPAIIGTITILLMAAPALSVAGQKHQSKTTVHSATAFTEIHSSPSVAEPSEKKPGPAWRTIGGTVKQVKDTVYTVEDYEGNQVQLFVSRETKQLSGRKKIGDHIRAEITHSGFANSIQ
ncbi:MAG: hypothetical protein KF876_05595 [Nitrospira sp.]|nr:hypothetical protein [Nitrospira sp.]